MFCKIFSKRLSEVMKLNNKKQIDIVNDLNIPRSAISQYLSGLYEPKIERVKQLADYFGVTEEWLMGYTNDPQGRVLLNNHDSEKALSSESTLEDEPGAQMDAAIGKRIFSLRNQLRLTIQEVSKRGGCPIKKIKAIEDGSIDFFPRDIQKIANGLGIDIEAILNWDQKQVNKYTQFDDAFIITEKERQLILAYRTFRDIQPIIDKILDLPETTPETKLHKTVLYKEK